MDPKASLRQLVDESIGRLIPEDVRRIVLIDPPNHANVGDQAILLGEHAFLARHVPNARIDFIDVVNYSERCYPLIDRADIILIHGGGNFGDLWPRHHELRKQILARFPRKRIVQLPQSMSFSDPAELAETARLIERCEDLTLCIRDNKSLTKAQDAFDCKIVLCPDMAFAMHDITRRNFSSECFALLRTDKEAAADHAAVVEQLSATGMSFMVGDWLHEPNSLVKQADYVAGRLTRRFPQLLNLAGAAAAGVRIAYARASLARGIAMLSQGRVVLSDRLHAHVISCLLGIPNIVLDSLDGKVSGLYETWTNRFTYAELTAPDDVSAALQRIR